MPVHSVCFGVPSNSFKSLKPSVKRTESEKAKSFTDLNAFLDYCSDTHVIQARVQGNAIDSPRIAAILASGAIPLWDPNEIYEGTLGAYPRELLAKGADATRDEWRTMALDNLTCGKTVQKIVECLTAESSGSSGAKVLFCDPTFTKGMLTSLSASILVGLRENGVDVDVSEGENFFCEVPKTRSSVYQGSLAERKSRPPETIERMVKEKSYDYIFVGGWPETEASTLVINKLVSHGYSADKIFIVMSGDENLSTRMLKVPATTTVLDNFHVISAHVDPIYPLTLTYVKACSENPTCAALASVIKGNASAKFVGSFGPGERAAAMVSLDAGGRLDIEGDVENAAMRKISLEPVESPEIIVLDGPNLNLAKNATRFIAVLGNHGADIDTWLVENPSFYRYSGTESLTVIARLPEKRVKSKRSGSAFAELVLPFEGSLNVVVLGKESSECIGWRDYEENTNVIFMGRWNTMDFRTVQDELRNFVSGGGLSVVNGSNLQEKLSRVSGVVDILEYHGNSVSELALAALLLRDRNLRRFICTSPLAENDVEALRIVLGAAAPFVTKDGSHVFDF